MQCSRCDGSHIVKIGSQSGKQRFRCQDCRKSFTENTQKGYSEELKVKAIAMYLEGLGFRAIGRLLCVSNVTVLNWVKQAADKLPQPAYPATVDVVEIDELWHFVKKRHDHSGSGLLLTVSETASLTSKWAAVVSKR